ncbi:hypothetical protein F4561_000848 [Lipingzhangella halophila]|uniref:Uncharacterized protein n=1 Tax=Lipingzhangella halophila TaxID=1783352 RepID=A0A7W7W178_9ACTN|nr:hypothetical protein [Lipingzhangella halophila]MBB4930028.1 hypothetical protein [Lipingzhangella halophila]
MSLVFILAGAVLVVIALFNRVPQLGSEPAQRSPARAAAPGRLRLRLVHARLTETGRATLTTVGGSVLIIAFFLALAGI